MNERFKQLWEQAAKTTQGDSWEEQTKFMEKFAQLIVEECAQRAEAYAYMSQNFVALAEELRRMKQHFGVEA